MSEMFECSSLALYERFERKHKYNIVVFKMLHQELQKYSRILHFSKSTEVLKLNYKSFTLCDHQLAKVMLEFKNSIL